MAEVIIPTKLWRNLSDLARRQRREPDAVAVEALQEYVQRVSDEDLLARSDRAARRSKFRLEDTEAVIRQARRRRRDP